MPRIKDLPINERPREKALLYGLEALTNIELLAIIIGQGVKGHNALDVATQLLIKAKSLHLLKNLNLEQMKEIPGLNQISSLRIGAVFTLFSRFEEDRLNKKSCRLTPHELFLKYREYFYDKFQEQFILLLLNTRGEIIKEIKMYKGTAHYFPLSMGEVFAELLSHKCFSFVIVHNHPGGEAYPSDEDIISTIVIKDEALKLKIKLKDHLIISADSYYSFLENKLL
ncbi:MAG: DNA repair protein RadC [Bacilli bacterium]|nr:DNA repair protein RadC [Bacilli bacterium]NLN80501.1 DNA repair protein RadC [Erysipelotrichia bacterium]